MQCANVVEHCVLQFPMNHVATLALVVTVVIPRAIATDRNAPGPAMSGAQSISLRTIVASREPVRKDELKTASSIATRPRTQLLSRSGAPVDLDGLTVQAFIDRWSQSARTGNAKAAYRIYQAEALCARAAENERSLRDDASLGEGAERESIEAHTKALEELCIGTSPAEADERLQFLTQAARSGDANAQIDFFMEGPYGKPYELQADDPDPNVIAWKVQSLDFLKQAAMQNHRDALEFLSMAYFNGLLVREDLEASLTYEIALARASNKDPDLALLAAQLIRQLPESSVARARVAGETLYRQCCSNRGP